MNRTDFQRLSTARLAEAKALFAAGLFGGAYYLAGYAVECALKACIAKRTQQFEFPDKDATLRAWSHDFERLVVCAGLDIDLAAQIQSDLRFRDAWHAASDWTEGSRYNPSTTPAAAALLLDAIERTPDGVLPWIHARW